MQCVQVWFGPGLHLVIEEVKLFCLRKVNPRVLAQVGGQGCRATFLGTADRKLGLLLTLRPVLCGL